MFKLQLFELEFSVEKESAHIFTKVKKTPGKSVSGCTNQNVPKMFFYFLIEVKHAKRLISPPSVGEVGAFQ